MSQENVEIVRRSLDAWNRRDIADALALVDAEAEYVNPASAVEPGTRRGASELTAVLRAQWEALTDGRWEIDRIYESLRRSDRPGPFVSLDARQRRPDRGPGAHLLEDQRRESRARRNARLWQGRGSISPRSRGAVRVDQSRRSLPGGALAARGCPAYGGSAGAARGLNTDP